MYAAHNQQDNKKSSFQQRPGQNYSKIKLKKTLHESISTDLLHNQSLSQTLLHPNGMKNSQDNISPKTW